MKCANALKIFSEIENQNIFIDECIYDVYGNNIISIKD